MSYAFSLRIFKCSFVSVVRRNCCFRGWKKSHRQGILWKGMFSWPIHFLAFDDCWWIWEGDSILTGSHTGENVLALQVKMWEKRKSVWRRSIYRKYVSWNQLQKNAGWNSDDVVLNTDHVVLLANGFPSLIVYVGPPSLFREQVAYRPF